ncbi:hypothetical protein [Chryseobacterium salviniae]|uniref:Organic solvent tolerance-like N-terminal domain-containing protein n=1 Tax=Chryseobacterium salviniae TaxID=3101750 RepID=A0ABU6HRI3_9FLAO|nr:hypothetical protein [Chryseobacterium sp. T9W2-O]MEC3875655.1 hypothetical protein [Chryseobacterium sp. T9W2-O]
MMKQKVMKSVMPQVFRFSERLLCFIMVIASVLYSGQSFSTDSPAIYIKEGTLVATNYESEAMAAGEKQKDTSESLILTGEEYLYIAEGTVVYTLDKAPVNTSVKKETAASLPQKRSIAENKSVRKKNVTGNSLTSRKSISAFPEQNAVHYISVSGQAVCAAPGNHHQNLIYYQQIRHMSAGQPDEYIPENYYFLFSAFSSNCIGAGGIRPPPFHC